MYFIGTIVNLIGAIVNLVGAIVNRVGAIVNHVGAVVNRPRFVQLTENNGRLTTAPTFKTKK